MHLFGFCLWGIPGNWYGFVTFPPCMWISHATFLDFAFWAFQGFEMVFAPPFPHIRFFMCFMDIGSFPNLKLFQCFFQERSISYIQSQRKDFADLHNLVNNVTGTNNCWLTFFGKSPNSLFGLKFEWFNTNIVWVLKNVELVRSWSNLSSNWLWQKCDLHSIK